MSVIEVPHRWERDDRAALWRCVPGDDPSACQGCGVTVTDEEVARVFGVPHPDARQLLLIVQMRAAEGLA